ncbi:MAG TPA: FixH family protein [Humisphaera sp.]
MNAAATPAVPAAPKRARKWWPTIIVGLLAGHTSLMVAFYFIATRDRSFSVDPDYYRKAVKWDEAQAERRASEQLGWKAEVRPADRADATGQRAVALSLTDAAGQPLPVAAIEVLYFHHAHGQDAKTAAVLADPTDGRRFPATLAMPHAGTWEFHLTAKSGTQTFVKTETVEVR